MCMGVHVSDGFARFCMSEKWIVLPILIDSMHHSG